MFGEEDVVRSHQQRAKIIFFIVFVSFLMIVSRLWYLQILNGEMLHNYSLKNKIRSEIVHAPRGMIFSRDSDLLVNNVPRFDAVMIPQFVQNKEEVIKKLSTILSMTEKEIKKAIKRNRTQAKYRAITIKKNISQREVAIIETEAEKIPGVRVDTFIAREYLHKEIGAHLLGYISEISPGQLPRYQKRDNFNYKLGDFIGQAGVEENFDALLRGMDGSEIVEVDAKGRMRRSLENDALSLYKGIKNKPAQPGNNLRLTIDKDMQEAAFKALEGKVGSVVAVDVNSGEILTMVSRPSFYPSNFSTKLTAKYWQSILNNENRPLRARSIQEHYAPGSTFKTLTALAALEEGIVDEKTTHKCEGSLKLGKRKFHCWKKAGHGEVDVVKALKESCDVYFYQIAKSLSIDTLAKYAKEFGLGRRSGIALPRETTGLVPSSEWKMKRFGKPWQKGETLGCVIGQSYVLTTPLQLARLYAAFANGGKFYEPQIVKEVFNIEGDVIKKPEVVKTDQLSFSEKNLKLIRKGLHSVVNEKGGTAYWYRLPEELGQMAGKTGTSQVIRFSADKIYQRCEDREYKYRHHGIFAAYAPFDKPEIAVSVIVEHGCHGSSAAAPVARDVIKTYLEKRNKRITDV